MGSAGTNLSAGEDDCAKTQGETSGRAVVSALHLVTIFCGKKRGCFDYSIPLRDHRTRSMRWIFTHRHICSCWTDHTPAHVSRASEE